MMRKKTSRTTVPPIALALINLPTGSLGSANDPNAILPALAERVAQILLSLAYPLAFLGLLYSIYLLIVNSGNPDAMKTTKKNIGFIATGIGVIILTYFLFNLIARIFR